MLAVTLALAKRLQDERASRLDAAHDLDDDVDVRLAYDVVRVVGEQSGGDGDVSRLFEIADGHPRHLDGRSRPPGDLLAVLVQHAGHRRAHVAAAEQADPDHVTHVESIVRLGEGLSVPAGPGAAKDVAEPAGRSTARCVPT